MAFIRDRGAPRRRAAIRGASATAALLLVAASAQGQAISPSAAAAVTATSPAQPAASAGAPGQPAATPGAGAPAAPGQAGKATAPVEPSVPQLSPPQSVSRPAKRPGAAPRARTNNKKKQKEVEAPRVITGPVATYPGFRMLEGGGSRVFVSVSKKVPISEHKAQGRVTYRLQGVAAPVRTNRLPLLTNFFPTPVGRVQLVEQGSDVDLVIELRAPSDAKHRIVERDGTILLQVDFPRAENLAVQPPTSAGPERPRATRTTQTTSLGGGNGY